MTAPNPRLSPPAVALVAARLVDIACRRSVLFVAADEQRAEATAAIATALAPDTCVVHLPSSDALPGDEAPASPSNVGRRVAALRQLRALAVDQSPVILITTAEATAVRYPPPESYDAAPPRLSVGDPIDIEAFGRAAEEAGYCPDDRIDEPGELAIRGAVIDIFPADMAEPVRIEVADGRVAEIRAYDPVTQRGTEPLAAVELGRAAEPPLMQGGVSILAHLPKAAIAFDPDAGRRRQRHLALARDTSPHAVADRLVDDAEWVRELQGRDEIEIVDSDPPPPRFIEQRDPTRAALRFAKKTLEGGRLLITGSPRDLRFVAGRLGKALKREVAPVASWSDAVEAPAGALMCLTAPIDRGIVANGVTVIAGGDLLGGRARGDEAGGSNANLLLDAGVLHCGDVVIHEDYGIGIVTGLEGLPDGGEGIVLEYAKGGRRLVPTADADRIWRYGADADAVSLDTLDGASWEKRRGSIEVSIAESATALAALAAERDARRTDPVAPDTDAYERFASGFAFTETPDQARAIAAVRTDLASGKPMDRLVVGDVGYGKTEVALRAAALVALSGRQVAIAAPTTVLVRQHLETFDKRFKDSGIEVAGLSRLSTTAEKKRVKAGLADGSIKIVIGTGAIAGKDVDYADLALVVIDEEQRFGAADKAKLRALGAGHMLTLTATPIPRTLQSVLVGLQQVSVIATPPARRQPIRTATGIFDDAAVRAALLRERSRGGQSFVVVPRIEDMAPLAEKLARLVPDLKVVQAHGKMPAAEIDEAMVGFARGEGHVLLATNIIEAGLDVPRANTMVVHHADRFGLSQLHQLRGRVGRGGRRGQILLLTEPGATITEATQKRLRALQAFDRLGAGFAISARDLDLRGAGDLVGETQSGHMKLIGIDLYQHMFGQALRAARGETVDEWTPELRLGLDGCLPEDWIPEVEIRLSLYGRIARLREAAALDAIEEELEDRFGTMPEAAHDLLRLARLRILARSAGISRIDSGPAAVALTPRDKRAAPFVAELEAKEGRWLLAEQIPEADARADRLATLLGEIVEP